MVNTTPNSDPKNLKSHSFTPTILPLCLQQSSSSSEKCSFNNFIHHFSPKVGHVLLIKCYGSIT